MHQHLGLEQPLPNTCPKSSCWDILARFLRPWSRVAVWEQFIQSMFGVWIENFSEVHCMSFDPSCWALVLAIWEGRLKVASRPTVRNQVIETFFWRPFFGPPPQCAFHLLWFFMLGLGCDHIRDGLVSGCRKPSCWNVISNSFLWPAFRITVLKQFCGCWGSELNISSGCIASPLILHVGPRLWPMKCGHEDGPQTWTKNASKNHRDKGSNKAFQNDASFHLIWDSRTGTTLMPKPLMATARAYHDESKERNPDPQNKPQMFQKRSFWGKAQESSSNVEPRNLFGREPDVSPSSW